MKEDFYNKGYSAALVGSHYTTPEDISQFGPDAEAAWNEGYQAFYVELEREPEESEESQECKDI